MDVALATSPQRNVVVHAAAGTGKTWLLTGRIIRLLLEGAEPGAILAITFTRKAAGEIHERVTERLRNLAVCDEELLPHRLAEIGAPADPATRKMARGLYEKHLSAIHTLRTTTFHAFCQDILRRFPLEAGIPPGFELVEDTSELEETARSVLDRWALREPSGELSSALDCLLRECGGVHGTMAALEAFLQHRSDWWAYVENKPDPVGFAEAQLRRLLQVADDAHPVETFLGGADTREKLKRYGELLSGHATTTNLKYSEYLERAISGETLTAETVERIKIVFLKQDGDPRELKLTQTLERKLGPPGAAELVALHREIQTSLLAAVSQEKKQWTHRVSRAWYVCGTALLEEYQRQKLERGLLDFADLEWKTCSLLNRSRHAEWVQYKLDQRIDHLLVDEFQDTNPTQWRLLLPLLNEMVAGDPERRRSVFLVGDEKQSVYRFRRADPRLFHAAHHWLEAHAQAQTLAQHLSRRSSPAVIAFVNLLFHRPEDAEAESDDDFLLEKFALHETHHKHLWGRAELLPLVVRRQEPVNAAGRAWRNPLQQPRQTDEDTRHRHEGELIAGKIRELMGSPIADGDSVRPLNGDDVMILLRDRTQARHYEEALRRANLPYIGTGRGAFRQSLEVRDLLHLLHHLVEPYNNLALASALRSPLFAATEQDLVRLAQSPPGFWRERLARLPATEPPERALARARNLLPRWSEYAVALPVHDLLDRIYAEGNVVARYVAAAVTHLKPRVEANLNHLLEVALDIDSGRYPGLSHFLHYLENMTDEGDKTPSQPAWNREPRVRVMTIHAAKGLEAPVVFLADATRGGRLRDRGMQTLIDWPVDADRPRYFHLGGKAKNIDDVSRELKQQQQWPARREEANLLYVALTRARQRLYVSGCEPEKGSRGWYGFIEKRLRQAVASGEAARAGLRLELPPSGEGMPTGGASAWIEFGEPPVLGPAKQAPAARFQLDPLLTKPFPDAPVPGIHHPSRFVPEEDGPAADIAGSGEPGFSVRHRGVVMHRMLEQLARGNDRAAARIALHQELGDQLGEDTFTAWWQSACRIVDEPRFRELFDPTLSISAHNEIPILFRHGAEDVYGVIDRVVVRENEVILVDYKTHAGATTENMAQYAERFREQMRWYAEGVRHLWPGKKVRKFLLFTACAGVVEIPP